MWPSVTLWFKKPHLSSTPTIWWTILSVRFMSSWTISLIHPPLFQFFIIMTDDCSYVSSVCLLMAPLWPLRTHQFCNVSFTSLAPVHLQKSPLNSSPAEYPLCLLFPDIFHNHLACSDLRVFLIQNCLNYQLLLYSLFSLSYLSPQLKRGHLLLQSSVLFLRTFMNLHLLHIVYVAGCFQAGIQISYNCILVHPSSLFSS